uniref:Meiotic kinetochore factor n=1 Tax=Equus caballus TaxID=9796 RepID=A0A9L0RSN3_HORSE
MWPLRVYTRKKRADQRLNLTPTPDLAEPPPGPGRRLAARCLKGNDKAHGLPKIAEKAERSAQGAGCSGLPSTQLRVTGEKNLQESSTSEELRDEKMAPLSESVPDDLQIDSSSSNSELLSGLSLQHEISSSLLSYSITDSYTEYKSFEESLSSFPSPELFRGSDCLDWERPKLEYLQCKNSTLLDTSKAVPIEKASQFSNLSAILSTSSEDYQKCHRKIGMLLADQNIPPKPKNTSNSESDNAACEVLLAEKTCPSTPEKTKKKPEKDPEPRDTNFQTKLSSQHLKIKVPSSQQKSTLESSAGRSVTKVLLPQPLETALVPSKTSEVCYIIRASPGTRQVKSKSVIVKKKTYSPPKDIPQDIIIKTNGRM